MLKFSFKLHINGILNIMICACVCSSFCKLPMLVAWNSKYLLVDVSVCVFSWVFCEHYGSKEEFSWGKYGLLLAPGKTEKSHLLLQFVVNPICSEFFLFLLLSPPPSLSPSCSLFCSFTLFFSFFLFPFSPHPPPPSLRDGGMGGGGGGMLLESGWEPTASVGPKSSIRDTELWPLPVKCYMDWGLPLAWSVVRFFTSSLPG